MTAGEIITIAGLALIAYVAFGYYAILLILARLRPKPVIRGPALPRLTLLICAYNEADGMAAKIRNTLALDYPEDRLRIVVVSDGSADDTAAIARREGKGKVLALEYPERRGKPTAVNLGIAASKGFGGEIVVFSDARPLYTPDALKKLVRNFADPSVGAAAGDYLYLKGKAVGRSSNKYLRLEASLKGLETASGSTVGVNGSIFAVRRELIPALPAEIINEDAFIALRVLRRGKRIVSEPEAVCYDKPPIDATQDMRRRTRILAGRVQLLLYPDAMPWQHPDALWRYVSHKVLRLALPLPLLACFLPPLACFLSGGRIWWMNLLLLTQILFYGMALVGWLLEKIGLSTPVTRLPYFIARNIFAAIPACFRLLRGKETMLWPKIKREQRG